MFSIISFVKSSCVTAVKSALNNNVPENPGAAKVSVQPSSRQSLHHKSASQQTHMLNERGQGEGMAQGVTNMTRDAYWQGRTDQKKIDKG